MCWKEFLFNCSSPNSKVPSSSDKCFHFYLTLKLAVRGSQFLKLQNHMKESENMGTSFKHKILNYFCNLEECVCLKLHIYEKSSLLCGGEGGERL